MMDTNAGRRHIPVQDLGNNFTRQQIGEAVTSKIQELIILPTEKCNLRCTYCYEDFAIGKMRDHTQHAIERLISRRAPELKKLTLSWFGGEPLTAKEIVLRLARHADTLCRQYGVAFNGGLTTNAVLLTRGLFEQLLEHRQDFFQITLDGWGDVHDKVRRHSDGRGSFDAIWTNLLEMQKVPEPFEVVLRVHVRRDNVEELELLLTQIAAQFGADARFRIDFQHLRNLGGDGGKTVHRPLSLQELFEIEQQLRVVYQRSLPQGSELDTQARNSSGEAAAFEMRQASESAGGRRSSELNTSGNYICYAARPNSLLIRADGRLAKCTVAFDDDRNTIGRIRDDGTLEVDNDKLQPWIRGLQSLDVGSLACPLSGLGVASKPHVSSESLS
jgi:uncharacterized protein